MKAKSHEVSSGLAILLQTTIIQLIEAGAISLEQGERIFDAAEKVARKSSPGAVETVRYVRSLMKFDEFRQAKARKKPH